jgi:hypothetical protein
MAKPIITQVVERARTLIANEATWCQGSFAEGADGYRCDAYDPRAVRFCAYGALQRAAYQLVGTTVLAEQFSQKAAVAITGRSLARARATIMLTNDRHGREAVLRLFEGYLAGPPAPKRQVASKEPASARAQKEPADA